MATFEETGPRAPVTTGTRVDKIRPVARISNNIRMVIVIILTIAGLIPVVALGITAFKSRSAVVSVPPSLIPVPGGDELRVEAVELWRETKETSIQRHYFEPTLEGFVFLLTERAQAGPASEDARRVVQDVVGAVGGPHE